VLLLQPVDRVGGRAKPPARALADAVGSKVRRVSSCCALAGSPSDSACAGFSGNEAQCIRPPPGRPALPRALETAQIILADGVDGHDVVAEQVLAAVRIAPQDGLNDMLMLVVGRRETAQAVELDAAER